MPRYLVEFSEKISSIIYNAEMVRFAKTGSDARTASVRVVKTSTVKQSLKGNIMKTVMTF